MARRKVPQRTCREASKGSLEAKADQEPAGEAAGPSRCQTSGHKMAPQKNWFVTDRQRMQFLRDMRFFRVILLLLLVALGIYCTTSMPGWTTRAKGWMEEQICGSAIKRKIQSDYQALLVAQSQNMRRLLQEVAQLRVQLISARKEASEAASQVSVEMSDWALQSAGAAIDTRRTSQTYSCQGNWICSVIQLFRTVNPPEAVLQGLDADGEEETLLGTFVYNVAKEPIQTFPLKEQICGSAIKRKIQSDYQALLVAQSQNMRRLLQEVAQLRVQLISARKEASEAASQVSVEMSDWALQSAGAAIDTRRTSQTYSCQGNWICSVIQLFRTVNPPEAVLQGLDADGEEETLLGTFMYNVAKEPIQTFPLKNSLQAILAGLDRIQGANQKLQSLLEQHII
ncbi:hypothetical protein Q9233_012545, partial [Columba guinea]